jgi:nicotinate phosphoribosyltransferase
MTDGPNIASPEEIRSGRVADVYLHRGEEVLRAEGENPMVVAEVRAASFPSEWTWGVFAGLDDALWLLDGAGAETGKGIEVQAVEEGSVFFVEEPVLSITGPYLAFGHLETALLGMVCQATGVATAAARCKLAAGTRPVYSFGARRVHPSIVPMVERAAYIGGCDGVSAVKSAELLRVPPVGTMPDSLVLLLGEERAWRSYDQAMDARLPRVVVADTFQDEKFGAVAAALTLGKRLAAVRLEIPASRRGDLPSILREVRWELDGRGFRDVKIFAAGGLDERTILAVNRHADAYGVGAAVANAPVVEFSLDIVEVDGRPRSRRGKLSGRKHLWECPDCGNRGISPWSSRLGHCPRCGHKVRELLETWISKGRRKRGSPPAHELRERALQQITAAPDPFARGR